MISSVPSPRHERLLEAALLLTFVMHGLAMLGMAGLLLPMMPGGGTVSDVERIAAIAAHPWRFRLGHLEPRPESTLGRALRHLLRHLERDPDGTIHLLIDPGAGSGPDAEATLRPTHEVALPAPFSWCFERFEDFLAYCVPQDRAMSTQPWWPRVTRQEIDLGIPLAVCERLDGDVTSRAAAAIVGDARPLCFRVPSVSFVFSGEEHDPG